MMNKHSEKNNHRSMLITKDSLRPPCKRQRTRSGRCDPTQVREEQKEIQQVAPIEEEVVKTKCRRQWEQWGEDDQEIFFQGLAEYGKDYAKIKLLMTKKLKSKSVEESKTKEQIRHFYHRTWSKISKTLMLEHIADTKKAHRREMHYMLCLGEMKKKGVQGLGQKVLKQLHELTTKGSTYIRYRGRSCRIRPPNRFLKKLYRDVAAIPDIDLPKTVNIEFLPNTNSAFNYVQKHAFNPRLRFTNVNINARFTEVFDMIDKRFTDLYTNESLELIIYPLQTQVNNLEQFAEKLLEAEELLENCFQKQDIPIVLENSTKASDEPEVEDQTHVFPKLFGKSNEKDTVKKQKVKLDPYPGYWTYSTAEKIYIRTLYVALGQTGSLKFKYEWNLIEKKKNSFASDAHNFLIHACREETNKKIEESKQQKTIAPKKNTVHIVQKPIVPGVIAGSNGMRLTNKSPFALPLRPRPGRKRLDLSSQQSVPMNRVIAPRVNTSNSKLLNNAVAVNLIPQPPQLVQYANLPHNSIKLINSPSTDHLATSLVTGPFSHAQLQASDILKESQQPYHEVVLDEGCIEHFKSLKNILATASTLKQDTNGNLPTTPTKGDISPLKIPPSSPNLEWLNNTQDLTLTSFLNVCEMQEIQERSQEIARETTTDGSQNADLNRDQSNGGLADPTLPIVHTGDTFNGFEGISFELSNQGELRPKEQFTL